jgi:predicted small lipoprotein YifL
MKRIVLMAAMLALSACGTKAPLEPAKGEQLPPAPYGQDYQPTADELLEPSEQAVPERNVELRERSEEREDDPYDLPPE